MPACQVWRCSCHTGRSLLRVLGCAPIQDLHELSQGCGLLLSAHAGIPACQKRLDTGRMLRQGPARGAGPCQRAASSCSGLIALQCLRPYIAPEALMLASPMATNILMPGTYYTGALHLIE